MVLFENSPHVQHYKSHQNAYMNAITQFLSKCLQDKQISHILNESKIVEKNVNDIYLPNLTK